MTLEKNKVYRQFSNTTGIVSVSTGTTKFGRNLRRADKTYRESPRDVQVFMRRLLLDRISEGKAMLSTKKMSSDERVLVKAHISAYKTMWDGWQQEITEEIML